MLKKVRILVLLLLSVLLLSSCTSKAEKEVYETKLRDTVNEILEQSVLAEDMISKYSKMWGNSIERSMGRDGIRQILGEELSESQINNYFEDKIGYAIYKGDFNTALQGTYKYFVDAGKVSDLETGRENIANAMKELNNPSEEYNDVYDITFELYSIFEKYTVLALSPTGSLITFNQNANELSSEIQTKIKEFEIKIPNE